MSGANVRISMLLFPLSAARECNALDLNGVIQCVGRRAKDRFASSTQELIRPWGQKTISTELQKSVGNHSLTEARERAAANVVF
jgi:hypothetical protein